MGKATMDLLYNQAMIWLGLYFSPWAAVIGIGTTFSLFAVKCLSLMALVRWRWLQYTPRGALLTHIWVCLRACVP